MYPFLIADDEPMLLKGLRYLLEQSDLPVSFIQEASNGREALQLASRDEIQIIITDIRMPDMDGLAFCHEMNSINPDSPIIILSGYESFAYAQEAIHYGVKDYLLKPVEKVAFLQSVQRVIQLLNEPVKKLCISDSDLAAVVERLFDGLHLNDAERVNAAFHFLQNMLAAYPLHTGIKAYKQVNQKLLSRLVKDLGPSFEPSSTEFAGNGKAAFFQWIHDDLRRTQGAVQRCFTDKELQIIQTAKRFVRANLRDELTLEELAVRFGYNPSYFSTLFKQKTGVSFLSYRTDARMNKAKELLQYTDMTILEVAIEAGYSEVAGFMRTFKKYTGVTPTEYRKGG